MQPEETLIIMKLSMVVFLSLSGASLKVMKNGCIFQGKIEQ